MWISIIGHPVSALHGLVEEVQRLGGLSFAPHGVVERGDHLVALALAALDGFLSITVGITY